MFRPLESIFKEVIYKGIETRKECISHFQIVIYGYTAIIWIKY